MGKKFENETDEIEEKLKREIKERKKIPNNVRLQRNKNIFRNLIFASAITLFFILLNIGYFTIEKTIYSRDTVIFSFVSLIVTIILFERAYRTEKGYYVLHGLEVLVASVFTYFIPYTYFTFDANISKFIMAAPTVFILYYIIKVLVIYGKSNKNKKNDIVEIIKKEEVKDDDSWIKIDKDKEAEEEKDESINEQIEQTAEIKVILPKEKSTNKKKKIESAKKPVKKTTTKKSSNTSKSTSKSTTKKSTAKKTTRKTTSTKKATDKKTTTKKKSSDKE